MIRRAGYGLTRAACALALASILAMATGCGDDATKPKDEIPPETYSGGGTTVFEASSNAFKLPAPNLSGAHLAKHRDGDVAFDRTFVSAPAERFGGLGPIFNQTSCSGCHVGNGRGKRSLLLRLSVPGDGEHGGPMAVPGLGLQLQDRAIFGRAPEGSGLSAWEDRGVTMSDGAVYTLRKPSYSIGTPSVPVPANVMLSPRIAPAVFGLGLLEAVPEATILDLAARQTGEVSGRPNYVWDAARGERRIGRFGWKANEPDLTQQTADAYNGDMGVTSPLRPVESSFGQAGQADDAADDPEIDASTLDATAFYVRSLGVPARRSVRDPEVVRGQSLFESAGCASCHVPRLETGDHPELPEVSRQTIFPFTDLLLHDMGDDLADGRPDFEATGREWRTAPLWGIGLLETVNGELELLHDGRARSFMEAILWHGGEGKPSSDRVIEMSGEERAALLAFLRSL